MRKLRTKARRDWGSDESPGDFRFMRKNLHVGGDEDYELDPWKKLLLRVVSRAVNDFVRYRHIEDKRLHLLAWDAYKWLFVTRCEDVSTPINGQAGFEFEWICEVLAVSPNDARNIVKDMKIEDLPKVDLRRD